MQSAPSVIFPVGRSVFYARLLVCLGVIGAVVSVAGALTLTDSEAHPSALLAGVAIWMLWAGFARWSWHRMPVGQLQWDAWSGDPVSAHPSGAWRWCSHAHQEGALLERVEPLLDLQSRVLLRLCNPDAATRWVWVEQHQQPSRWEDLRRALWAHT